LKWIQSLSSAVCFIVSATPAVAETSWVTLGTKGGPLPSAERSQPANALVLDNGTVILVDAGDGTAQQMARAGLRLDQVHSVFLSHMHFDHTAGVLGVISPLYQTNCGCTVTIYGPPGTQAFVNGMISLMQPFAESGFGIPGEQFPPPSSMVRVVEMVDGSTATIGSTKVTAAQNSHYSFPAGSEMDRKHKSLAYRFDLPDRSIAFTGDTGPSRAVEQLAKGADMLVTEMINVEETMNLVATHFPNMPEKEFEEMKFHQETQHLPYEEVGKLAATAGVKSVVLTHFVPSRVTPEQEAMYREAIGRHFSGHVTFARDLERF